MTIIFSTFLSYRIRRLTYPPFPYLLVLRPRTSLFLPLRLKGLEPSSPLSCLPDLVYSLQLILLSLTLVTKSRNLLAPFMSRVSVI